MGRHTLAPFLHQILINHFDLVKYSSRDYIFSRVRMSTCVQCTCYATPNGVIITFASQTELLSPLSSTSSLCSRIRNIRPSSQHVSYIPEDASMKVFPVTRKEREDQMSAGQKHYLYLLFFLTFRNTFFIVSAFGRKTQESPNTKLAECNNAAYLYNIGYCFTLYLACYHHPPHFFSSYLRINVV